MGLFTGIIGALEDSCACIVHYKFSKKVKFKLSDCYCQEGKYSGYRKLN